MAHYSISQLGGIFGLSRSTLLHYDAIDLLKPSQRTPANYRVYTDAEYDRLHRITALRKTGISLDQIRKILDAGPSSLAAVLHNRIDQINQEIQHLRFQQTVIIRLLNTDDRSTSVRVMSKEAWVNLLASAGLDENGMRRWHVEFERSAPEAHQDFLESIGLCPDEIGTIRTWSREDRP